MGSFGEDNYGKDENPALSWVQDGIDRFNERCRLRAGAAPWGLKLLALLGIRHPWEKWQLDHWYDFDERKDLGCPSIAADSIRLFKLCAALRILLFAEEGHALARGKRR